MANILCVKHTWYHLIFLRCAGQKEKIDERESLLLKKKLRWENWCYEKKKKISYEDGQRASFLDFPVEIKSKQSLDRNEVNEKDNFRIKSLERQRKKRLLSGMTYDIESCQDYVIKSKYFFITCKNISSREIVKYAFIKANCNHDVGTSWAWDDNKKRKPDMQIYIWTLFAVTYENLKKYTFSMLWYHTNWIRK